MLSHTIDLDGPVHYVDFGGSGRPIVLIHGLGGSHLNWLAVGDGLTRHGHVLALDLLGHGRTPSLHRTARVDANRTMLGRFLGAVAREPAVLIGNSMGGYLALRQAAAEPEKVMSLVLVDAAVPLRSRLNLQVATLFAAYTLPLIGEAMMRRDARLGPERVVRNMLALSCAHPDSMPQALVEAHVQLARERAGAVAAYGRDFLAAERSLIIALARRGRFFAMLKHIRARALILYGDRDRLIPQDATRALAASRPDWRLEVLENVGHAPQLETPDRFLALVEAWLGSAEK